MKPDRIAFYSYAHVPWLKGIGQRGFDKKDLPTNEAKLKLYETGKKILENCNYKEIGMDHFSLEKDPLFKASKNKTLHRNFMGYSNNKTKLMIGLGVSSIADAWYSFAQNIKTIKESQNTINNGKIPIFKGHLLSKEDLIIRKHILNIMCNFETSWKKKLMKFEKLPKTLSKLKEMEKDGLVIVDKNKIPKKARSFLRNICMAFDVLLQNKKSTNNLFSSTF